MRFPRATHLVVLCHRKAHALDAIEVIKAVFAKLELTINAKKSKLVNIWDDTQGFDFLGHHHRRLPVMRKGGTTARILRTFPSKKAMKKMRTKVKEVTSPRKLLKRSLNDMVAMMNPIIQGWRNYYAVIDPGAANQFLRKIDWHIRKRLTIFWNKKHKHRKTNRFDFYGTLTRIGLKTVCS